MLYEPTMTLALERSAMLIWLLEVPKNDAEPALTVTETLSPSTSAVAGKT